MKTLYFIGNEELWNDAWFTALVESLEKKSNLSVFVYDFVKDLSKIKAISGRLTVADRVILTKGLTVEVGLENKHKSLLYTLSKQKVDLNQQLFVEWGSPTDIFLEKLGISEASSVIEDDFLSEMNILSEVSKVIEAEEKSTLDNDALSSSSDDISKLLENDFSSDAQEAQVEQSEVSLELEFEQAPEKILDKTDEKIEESLNLSVESVSLDSAVEKNDAQKSDDDSSLSSLSVDLEEALGNDLENKEEIKSLQLDDGDLMLDLEGLSQEKEEPVKEQEKDFDIHLSLESPLSTEEKAVSEEIKPEIEVGKLLSSMSSEVSNEDMDVIKRYSNIKERELREAQASAEALRRQIRYFDERLKKSEEERRKLILKVEEVQNELRATSDKKDENRAQLKNIESHYEEKIKELQIQLESSQFQAGKLEKKLEDFRDRVRSDLQKIRTRERELASRLEIQKRDAEALLSAKDERLLNQKRDIDRLEFDIDSLRERLIDDVNRSEERRKRISRALQSLKLAQSVLSGLDEESLQKDEKSKAA